MGKLILKEWSNSYSGSVDRLKELGNKIIAVSKSGEQGNMITYKHFALTRRPKKGDLVEYYDNSRWKRAIVVGTEKDWWCLKDHLGLMKRIVAIGMVRKIIDEQINRRTDNNNIII